MGLLYCPTEVWFFFTTQLTNPHVYNVLGLAVEVSWDAKGIPVYLHYVFFVDQWALTTTTTIAVLIVNCARGKLKCLFRTTVSPIELLFFSAKEFRVSSISCWNLLCRLRTTFLKSTTPSKKWTGNTNVSPSLTSFLTASVLLALPVSVLPAFHGRIHWLQSLIQCLVFLP